MALREYEFTLIASAQLSEEKRDKLLEKYEGIWTEGSGWVIKKDPWGTLRLAYPIKKQFRGFYVCYTLATTSEAIAASEKKLRIDNDVLRYLNIKLSNEVSSEPGDAAVGGGLAETLAENTTESSSQVSPTTEPTAVASGIVSENNAEVAEEHSGGNTETTTSMIGAETHAELKTSSSEGVKADRAVLANEGGGEESQQINEAEAGAEASPEAIAESTAADQKEDHNSEESST